MDIAFSKGVEIRSDPIDGDSNFEWTNQYNISNTINPDIRSLFEFDITSSPPSASITSALLYWYQSGFPGDMNAGDVLCRRLTDNSWVQSTVTYNSAPSDTATDQATTTVGTAGGWYSWDVTDIIKTSKTAGNIFGCVLLVTGAGHNHHVGNDAYLQINADYYVKHQAGANNGNAGTSWATAWRNFGYGLQNCPDGSILHIASNSGTEYHETGPINSGTGKRISMVVEDVNTTTRGKCQVKAT